jgi:hypothetical protein
MGEGLDEMKAGYCAGYCSVCGGALAGGSPCAGGTKIVQPVRSFEARSIASGFVLSHKHMFGDASMEEINIAIGKIGKVLWDLNHAKRASHLKQK